jgi:hypothetical protein
MKRTRQSKCRCQPEIGGEGADIGLSSSAFDMQCFADTIRVIPVVNP